MKPTTLQILKLYWRHVRKYPFTVAGLLLAQLLGVITFRLFPPLIAANILERLANGQFTHGDVWGSFGHDFIVYAALVIGGGVVLFRFTNYFLWKLEGLVVRDLYQSMFNKLMSLSTSFHANNFSGSLVSRTNKLIGSYIRMADSFIYQFYGLLIIFVFSEITLYKKAPLFVWVSLAFSLLFIIFTIILSKRVRELSAEEASAQNRTTGYLADATSNVTAIKSFSKIDYEQNRFAGAVENTRHKLMAVMWASAKRDIFAAMITTSVQVAAIVIGAIAVIIYGLNIGTVFLIYSYSTLMVDRLWEFSSSTIRNFNRSMGDAQEAVMTLTEEPTVKDPQNPEEVKISKGAIEIENLDFTHDENNEALFHNLNLKIKAGEKVGLVGHSGSGKTTFTKLLLRFSDIDGGAIKIDGQNISHITQGDLRSHIAYVPQEPLLFHRSLSENIAYGQTDATKSEVEKVAKLAHAHEFIKDLANGYDTLVGERGVKLSGGQRQRVAIARAMIKDAPILVLDEATSALDSESELLIQDALWKLMEGRTAIVIAHRLSTVQKMDRIVVMEGGEIVEEGNHNELLDKKGVYASLWSHQSGGFLDE